MIPRERCTYSAIVDRPPLKLPNQARIVVWTIVNLEFWSISRAMARRVLLTRSCFAALAGPGHALTRSFRLCSGRASSRLAQSEASARGARSTPTG